MMFHDRRSGQHLEIHGGGYFAKPKAAGTLPNMARKSSEPVSYSTRKPDGPPDPLSVGGNRNGGSGPRPPAPSSNPAARPDPFKARRAG